MFINVILKLLFDITFSFINLLIVTETKLHMDTGKKCIVACLFWNGTKRASKFWVINAENAIQCLVRSLTDTDLSHRYLLVGAILSLSVLLGQKFKKILFNFFHCSETWTHPLMKATWFQYVLQHELLIYKEFQASIVRTTDTRKLLYYWRNSQDQIKKPEVLF